MEAQETDSPIVSMEQLVKAYRAAKVDLFYSGHPRLLDIAEYEHALIANLRTLQERLNAKISGNGDHDWLASSEFLGWPAAMPATLDPGPLAPDLLYSSPDASWREIVSSADGPLSAKFRQVSRCSVDLHIVSTIWIDEVGVLLDERLGSAAYGNRVRGGRERLGLGSFGPYLHAYKRWNDDARHAIRRALEDDKELAVVTLDATSFYHELDPQFLQDETFLGSIGVALTARQSIINALFVEALHAWARMAGSVRGLPVGLPASAVVANLALARFDHVVETQILPLHYGRYVDDLVIVLPKSREWHTSVDPLVWLAARSPDLELNEGGLSYEPSHLGSTRVRFENHKNRVLFLQGRLGLSLIASLEAAALHRTSEWRMLAVLPEDPRDVGTSVVAALQADGTHSESLGKAETLTARRADFSLRVRDLEAYARDLEPEEWSEHRREFYKTFRDAILSPLPVFDLYAYISRILRVAVGCGDGAEFAQLVDKLSVSAENVISNCVLVYKNADLHIDAPLLEGGLADVWRRSLYTEVLESVCSAMPTGDRSKSFWAGIRGARPESAIMGRIAADRARIERLARRLRRYDLALTPARFNLLPESVRPPGIPESGRHLGEAFNEMLEFLDDATLSGLLEFSNLIEGGDRLPARLWTLVFPTRPFRLEELPLLSRTFFSMPEDSVATLARLLGRWLPAPPWPRKVESANGEHEVFIVGEEGNIQNPRFAVANWRSHEDYVSGAISSSPVLTLARYRELVRFANSVIREPGRIDYLVMPELSIPSRWFGRFAWKLARRGTSLIAGVEHLVNPAAGVAHNQVWCNLIWDTKYSRTSTLYRQDKQQPAIFERSLLASLAGLALVPEEPWQDGAPPLVCHRGLYLGLLVCSEFTNVAYRASLRGSVDVMVIPEYNPDLKSFSSFLESAALDVHCFVVQVNDRRYGDSCIRGPYAIDWRRDVVRLKGGRGNSFLVGEVEPLALRKEQSGVLPAAGGKFKPFLDGFMIADERWVVP